MHARSSSRSYSDDNLQILRGKENSEKSNKLPPVPELAKLRDLWPEHWGDVLPAAIPCDPQFDYLRTPRASLLRKMYSEMITDPFFDDDWLRSLDKLFKIKS